MKKILDEIAKNNRNSMLSMVISYVALLIPESLISTILNSTNIFLVWSLRIAIIIIIFLVSLFWLNKKYDMHKQKNDTIINDTEEKDDKLCTKINSDFFLWDDSNNKRIRKFQEIRLRAKRSSTIMGIGLTYFGRDDKRLDAMLEKELKVRMIMLDPKTFIATSDASIKKVKFDDMFDRKGYSDDINTTAGKLKDIVKGRRNATKYKKGTLSLSLYNNIFSLNYVLIDEDSTNDTGEILIEWCLPFTSYRIATLIEEKTNKKVFGELKNLSKNILLNCEKENRDT